MTAIDPQTDPTGYVLAVADQREQRAKAATPGPYVAREAAPPGDAGHEIAAGEAGAVWLYIGDEEKDAADAEHIAAEANPAHALAEVALWRAIAAEHQHTGYTCPDLLAVVAAAQAYAGNS